MLKIYYFVRFIKLVLLNSFPCQLEELTVFKSSSVKIESFVIQARNIE